MRAWGDTAAKGMGMAVNNMRILLDGKGAQRKDYGSIQTCELAVVDHYDSRNQTVDVFLKGEPGGTVHRKIPILGSGGPLRIIRPLKGIRDGYPADPTVGVLLYMRSDSTGGFVDRRIQSPRSRLKHKGLGAVFIPDVPVSSEPTGADVVTSGGSELNIAPGDFAIWDERNRTGLVLKEDGSLSIVATRVDVFKKGKGLGDLLNVARSGESGGDASTSGTAFMRVTD